MFSAVVAIGSSSLRTDAYAEEIDGIPTALIELLPDVVRDRQAF